MGRVNRSDSHCLSRCRRQISSPDSPKFALYRGAWISARAGEDSQLVHQSEFGIIVAIKPQISNRLYCLVSNNIGLGYSDVLVRY